MFIFSTLTFCMSLMETGGVFGLTLSTKNNRALLDFHMRITMWCLLTQWPVDCLYNHSPVCLVELMYSRSVINSSDKLNNNEVARTEDLTLITFNNTYQGHIRRQRRLFSLPTSSAVEHQSLRCSFYTNKEWKENTTEGRMYKRCVRVYKNHAHAVWHI